MKKYSLKKVGIGIGCSITFLASLFIGNEIYTNVEIPDGFNIEGKNYSSLRKEEKQNELIFNMVEIGDWKKGLDQNAQKKMLDLKENNKPFGIIIKSSAKTELEAQADATTLLTNIQNIDVDYPIYLNIDEIVNNIEEKDLIKICKAYFNVYNNQNGKAYFVGIAGSAESLKKLGETFNDVVKLIIIDKKVVEDDLEFAMVYYKRTNTYYTNTNYKNIIEARNMNNNENLYTVKPKGIEETKYQAKGFDVSKHQGVIDWQKISKDIDFSIIRMAYMPNIKNGKEYIDTKFNDNVKGAKENNIPYGVYSWTAATTIEEAQEEARLIINSLGDNIPQLPIFYDIEGSFYESNPQLSAELSIAFCNEIRKHGLEAGIYTNLSIFRAMYNVNKDIDNYFKWLAWYPKDGKESKWNIEDINDKFAVSATGVGRVDIHQVTDKLVYEGIDTTNSLDVRNTVDINLSYLSLEELMNNNQINKKVQR